MISVHLAVQLSTELEVSIEKKDKVFLKRLQLFFNLFVGGERKLYLNTHVDGLWRLDFVIPQRSLLLSCFLFNSLKADFLSWQKSLAYSLRIFVDNFSLLSPLQ